MEAVFRGWRSLPAEGMDGFENLNFDWAARSVVGAGAPALDEVPWPSSFPSEIVLMSHESRTTRVLVVEDSPTQAKKLQIILNSLGVEVEIAHDGNEGLELFHGGQFDLVLSDVVMPGLSGYELLSQDQGRTRGQIRPGGSPDRPGQADRHHPRT